MAGWQAHRGDARPSYGRVVLLPRPLVALAIVPRRAACRWMHTNPWRCIPAPHNGALPGCGCGRTEDEGAVRGMTGRSEDRRLCALACGSGRTRARAQHYRAGGDGVRWHGAQGRVWKRWRDAGWGDTGSSGVVGAGAETEQKEEVGGERGREQMNMRVAAVRCRAEWRREGVREDGEGEGEGVKTDECGRCARGVLEDAEVYDLASPRL
ncbi:hypothetical protein DFH09DRAFT_1322502 [Mycena vulgaris]|nr:hypothetical protein DFH09DRAFT_1322502 [Mycena vulgaris]